MENRTIQLIDATIHFAEVSLAQNLVELELIVLDFLRGVLIVRVASHNGDFVPKHFNKNIRRHNQQAQIPLQMSVHYPNDYLNLNETKAIIFRHPSQAKSTLCHWQTLTCRAYESI